MEGSSALFPTSLDSLEVAQVLSSHLVALQTSANFIWVLNDF